MGYPMKRFLRCALFLTVALVCTLVLWFEPTVLQAQTQSPDFDINQVSPPNGSVSARSGAALFQENCAPCHGAQGNGDGPTAAELPGPPTAFADPQAIWELSPAQLFHTAKFGRMDKMMPPWQSQLRDDEIWRAVFYAWSLHTDQQATEQGASLYAESCAQCHGTGGAGDGPEATELLPDFSDAIYAMAHSQADWLNGWQTAHSEVGVDWSTNDQASVLEYIRTFSYIPIWESPYRPGNGVIAGVVEQRTAGGASVDGAEVTLDAYADFAPVATFTTTVGTDGRFEFRDLATDSSIVYFASSPSGGISYSSPVLTLSPEQPELETSIRIYESTDDPGGIGIDRLHWIIDSQPGALVVRQIIAFGSSADHAYLGQMVDGVDEPVTVAMMVPEGAIDITFENGVLGQRFRQVGNRIYDTTPMVPGEAVKQIIIGYALPYAGTQADIVQEFLYPVTQLNVLIADLPELEVSAPELLNVGSQDFQGSIYHILQGENLAASVVNVNLSGLLASGSIDPRAVGATVDSGSTTSASELTPWIPYTLGALVLLVLAGAFIWAWQRGRISSGERQQELRRQQGEIIRQIAHVDDLHALGELSEEAWRGQRSQLKAQLLSIAGGLDEPLAAENEFVPGHVDSK